MFGTPVQATVQRKPGSITMGQTGAWTDHVTLQCWKVFGSVMEPVSSTVAAQGYGVQGNVMLPHVVVADWPTTTETYPVKPGDRLVLPQGSYPIKGVKGYPNQQLELLIEVQV